MTDVAIVGIGCRLPSAAGPDGLWALLCDGRDAIRPLPPARADAGAEGEAQLGGFIEDLDAFGHELFGISAREAARMDVQQRLALETAFDALEDACLAPARLAGSRTGVFMGVSTYDHGAALLAGEEGTAYDGTGSALSIVANRISYWLDARGPSLAVDTACSSSLVALALACRSLSAGETELALAGGVNAVTNPRVAEQFAKAGLMAKDGRCRPFDRRASGYVRGEGAGVVILKPLERARADRDRVYCVVRGAAVNHDGRSNGLSAPSRFAQEAVLRDAYEAAGVAPAEVEYVEAHGTGTPVGDPIEIAALASVLGAGREKQHSLRVGSLKSNIGHLEAAAGVAGAIKAALSLHHGRLPRTLHFEEANPMLGLDHVPIEVQARAQPWPSAPGPRLAGVSSFGFGGTNAHLVLASAPPVGAVRREDGLRLMPVSAASEEGLRDRLERLAELAGEPSHGEGWWQDAAAALALRADHQPYRAAVVAAGPEEGGPSLRALAGEEPNENAVRARRGRRRPRVAFVFSGQGGQHAGMGVELDLGTPVFHEALRACVGNDGHPLWGAEGQLPEAEAVEAVQPALFAVQVAMAATWRSLGIEPAGVIGHSMGEIAAAQAAGCLSLEEAIQVVTERSSLLSEIAGQGGLLLVELGAEEAEALVAPDPGLAVAACNGPRATVLTGPPDRLDDLCDELQGQKVFARRVAVDVAAHGPQVDALQPRLRKALGALAPAEGEVPLYSTVAGSPVRGTELDGSYWAANLRAPVLFRQGIERMLADGFDTFVEISPHPVLSRVLASLVAPSDGVFVSSLHRDGELHWMLRSLGELYAAGSEVDWPALFPAGAPHVALPHRLRTQRRFPLARMPRRTGAAAVQTAPGPEETGLLGAPQLLCSDAELEVRELRLGLDAEPELVGHVLDGAPCVPAAGFLAGAAQHALERFGAPAVELRDVELEQICRLGDEGPRAIQLAVRPAAGDAARFRVDSSPAEGGPSRHATGAMHPADPAPASDPPIDVLRRCARRVPVGDCYARLAAAGLEYGDAFRRLDLLAVGDDEAIGRVRGDASAPSADSALDPITLDCCLHVAACLAPDRSGVLPIPAGAERVWCGRGEVEAGPLWSHARLREVDERHAVCDISICDDSGTVAWRADGFRVALIRRRGLETKAFEVGWQPGEGLESEAPPGRWLVLGNGATAAAVADGLRSRGNDVETEGKVPGGRSSPLDGRHGLTGVVDARALDPAAGERIHAVAETAFALARDLAGRTWPDGPPDLCFLTAGTQEPATGGEMPPGGGLVWGLARTLANEFRDSRCSVVEVEPGVPAECVPRLLRAICDPAAPAQSVVLRDGTVLSPRVAASELEGTGAPVELDPSGTYAITGGFGALGLWSADWLAQRGARQVLLIGRSKPSPSALERIEELRERGVGVDLGRADVASRSELTAVLGRSAGPVRGVIHAAGSLADALVPNVDPATLRAALSGKAIGAWHLHELFADAPLDHFVLYSSLAGLLGAPGQSAYAAANAFLDSLAAWRRAQGLPALSVDWGPWPDRGLAVEAGSLDALARMGILTVQPEAAARLLDAAVQADRAQVAIASFDWKVWRRAGGDGGIEAPVAAKAAAGGGPLTAQVMQAPAARRQRVLRAALTEITAEVVRQPPAELDPAVPFQELGFDSLMAMELCEQIEKGLGETVSATLIWGYPTIDALVDELLQRMTAAAPASNGDAGGEAVSALASAEPAKLSDDELVALVSAELELLEGGDRDG